MERRQKLERSRASPSLRISCAMAVQAQTASAGRQAGRQAFEPHLPLIAHELRDGGGLAARRRTHVQHPGPRLRAQHVGRHQGAQVLQHELPGQHVCRGWVGGVGGGGVGRRAGRAQLIWAAVSAEADGPTCCGAPLAGSLGGKPKQQGMASRCRLPRVPRLTAAAGGAEDALLHRDSQAPPLAEELCPVELRPPQADEQAGAVGGGAAQRLDLLCLVLCAGGGAGTCARASLFCGRLGSRRRAGWTRALPRWCSQAGAPKRRAQWEGAWQHALPQCRQGCVHAGSIPLACPSAGPTRRGAATAQPHCWRVAQQGCRRAHNVNR